MKNQGWQRLLTMDYKVNTIKCCLANVQSVTNKSLKINELINERNLDIFCITETWLKEEEEDKSKIKECTPSSHKFMQRDRNFKKGGGIGVIIYKAFKNVTTDSAFTSKCYEHFKQQRI